MNRKESPLDTGKSDTVPKRERLTILREVIKHWGMEKVQHYQWANAGKSYCNVLCAAASRNTDWEEASNKLNQLLLKKIVSKHPLQSSTNPIALEDLRQLKRWSGRHKFRKRGRRHFTLPYRSVLSSELPSGYAFDQYGLIVRDEFGRQLGSVKGWSGQAPLEGQRDCKSSMVLRSSTKHPPSRLSSTEVDEDTVVCINEDDIQLALLRAMSDTPQPPSSSGERPPTDSS